MKYRKPILKSAILAIIVIVFAILIIKVAHATEYTLEPNIPTNIYDISVTVDKMSTESVVFDVAGKKIIAPLNEKTNSAKLYFYVKEIGFLNTDDETEKVRVLICKKTQKEICGDGVDDDCDGVIDNPEVCDVKINTTENKTDIKLDETDIVVVLEDDKSAQDNTITGEAVKKTEEAKTALNKVEDQSKGFFARMWAFILRII